MTHGSPTMVLAKTCIVGGSRGPLQPSWHREEDQRGAPGSGGGRHDDLARRAAGKARLTRRRTRPMLRSTADRASASAGSARRGSSARRSCTCPENPPYKNLYTKVDLYCASCVKNHYQDENHPRTPPPFPVPGSPSSCGERRENASESHALSFVLEINKSEVAILLTSLLATFLDSKNLLLARLLFLQSLPCLGNILILGVR